MGMFIDRLESWRQAALGNLRKRSWKAWFLVVGLGYVVLEVVRAWISDAGTILILWGFEGLQWLLRQPMGVGGLGIIALIVILIAFSWWETRPRPEPDPDEPKPVSVEERRLIQDLRAVWNRHGRLAVSQMRDLLRDAVHRLDSTVFWAPLLAPVVQTLDQRISELEQSLDPGNHPRIATVRNRFNTMYQAYIRAMRWVAQLQSEGLFDVGDRGDHRLQVWRQNHRDMYDRLQDLSEDPEHRGSMNIFMNWIDNPAFREFLFEAQTSPEWLKLMRELEHESAEQVEARSEQTS